MPIAFVLVVAGVDRAAVRIMPTRRDLAVFSSVVVVLLVADMRFLPEISLLRRPLQVANAWENVNTALVLEHLSTADASVLVLFAG